MEKNTYLNFSDETGSRSKTVSKVFNDPINTCQNVVRKIKCFFVCWLLIWYLVNELITIFFIFHSNSLEEVSWEAQEFQNIQLDLF